MKKTKLHVAHFNDILFNPTETFIYNYLISFSQTTPVCFSIKRENSDIFPFPYPINELYKWNTITRKIKRRIAKIFWSNIMMTRYETPLTLNIIKEKSVQVLHAHFGHVGCQVLPVKIRTSLPLITTFYGIDVSCTPFLKKWRDSYKKLFAEGDLFLVEGPFMQNRLIELGCDANKIQIQRIAIITKNYPYRERIPKLKNKPVRLLFCGRFREKKGIILALDAVMQAHQVYQNFKFVVIGDGELWDQVEERVDRNRMKPYTKLLGFQPHNIMIEEMYAADLFIHPSITAIDGDSEGGAPTTILEAQACGLPVISTTHADIPNVVIPGGSALLSPERDIESLRDNLLFLLNNQEQWSKMGKLGRTFIEENHEITKEVIRLEERYHTIAKLS